MTLEPNEEQALLRDMVVRFLADHVAPEQAARETLPMDQWRALGELGVLALTTPEAAGGLGGGAMEAALVGEALGAAAALTPMADVAILSARLLSGATSHARAEKLLSAIMTGETLVAYSEAGPGFGNVAITPAGDSWILTGERVQVRHGDQAAAFIVATDESEPSLLLIDADTPGLTVLPYRLADGEQAARLVFNDVQLDRSAHLDTSPAERRLALALAQLAIVAEMIGLMQTLYDATVQYVRERRQFGAPIGSFQVVQHRVARLFILLEQSRSMLARAIHAAPETFERRVLEARAYVADAALPLAQDATQLHGGMGVTDELLVGRGHRRLLVLSHQFGGAIGAREALAA